MLLEAYCVACLFADVVIIRWLVLSLCLLFDEGSKHK